MLEEVYCEKCENRRTETMKVINHCPIVVECQCRNVIVTECRTDNCDQCEETISELYW